MGLFHNVSIPYTSGHPFLLRLICINWLWARCLCQSPIHRDTHFYAYHSDFQYGKQWCVNPLYIGTPISTCALSRKHWKQRVVSIPYTSGHPFLLPTRYAHLKNWILGGVNPLYIGTPISTTAQPIWHPYLQNVSIPYTSGHPFLRPYYESVHFEAENSVNPLYIGTPISTGLGWWSGASGPSLCQSPIHRDTHFYVW